MVELIIITVVLLFGYWAIHRVATSFGAPAPILAVFDVILVFIFLAYVLKFFGYEIPKL